MTVFRPCIDLHRGVVKQIVGSSLDATTDAAAATNFTAKLPASHYARLFRDNNLRGGHVIMLGPGNEDAAMDALTAWPGFLQVGGGITAQSAPNWINAGASHVIITSFLFPNACFNPNRLHEIEAVVGRNRLIIDLSCKRAQDGNYYVATNKWTTITNFQISQDNIRLLEAHCAEFLIHACDVEGLRAGVDSDLVSLLAKYCSIPCTYAGGADSLDSIVVVDSLSNGSIDITYGSALDIYGGSVSFTQLVELSNKLSTKRHENDTSIAKTS